MPKKRIFLNPVESAVVRKNIRVLGIPISRLASPQKPGVSRSEYFRLRARINGTRKFRRDELDRLARLFGVRREDLLRRTFSYSELHYYVPDRATVQQASGARESSLRALERAFKTESAAQDSSMVAPAWPPLTLPDKWRRNLYRLNYRLNYAKRSAAIMEARARFVREYWCLGNAPIASLMWVLRRAGVWVREVELEPRCRDLPIVSGKLGEQNFIGLTRGFSDLPWHEKRELLAVQIGRLYMRDETEDGRKAIAFARAFLLPSDVRKLWPGMHNSPSAVRQYARAFGLSSGWVMERCADWQNLKGDADGLSMFPEPRLVPRPWLEEPFSSEFGTKSRTKEPFT